MVQLDLSHEKHFALKRCNLFNDRLAERFVSEHMGAVDCGPLQVDLDTASRGLQLSRE